VRSLVAFLFCQLVWICSMPTTHHRNARTGAACRSGLNPDFCNPKRYPGWRLRRCASEAGHKCPRSRSASKLAGSSDRTVRTRQTPGSIARHSDPACGTIDRAKGNRPVPELAPSRQSGRTHRRRSCSRCLPPPACGPASCGHCSRIAGGTGTKWGPAVALPFGRLAFWRRLSDNRRYDLTCVLSWSTVARQSARPIGEA